MRFALAGLLISVSCLAANDVAMAPDRMLTVNGQRTFVLGLYEYPKEDAALDEAVKAGFNLIQASADAAQLDRLHAHNAHAWINLGGALDLSENAEANKVALKKLADTYAGHPALLVWEVPDEALWNVWYGAEQWRNGAEVRQQNELIGALEDKAKAEKLRGMRGEASRLWRHAEYAQAEQLADAIWKELGKEPPQPNLNVSNAPERAAKMAAGLLEGYTYLKGIAPNHPIWMNHAPRNSVAQRAVFNKAADAVGCDIYPVPAYQVEHSDLSDRSLASTGAYTRLMQEASPEKAVWMVLQGFGWADLSEAKNRPNVDLLRQPTYDETRFMAYDTIVNGARGILYWGTAYTDKTKPFWPEFLKVVRELADLQPVLSAPDTSTALTVSLAETWGSLDRGVRVLGKQAPDGVWLVVVNESQDPMRYTLNGLQSVEGVSYTDPAEGAKATVKNGALELTIRGFGVQVLRPGK